MVGRALVVLPIAWLLASLTLGSFGWMTGIGAEETWLWNVLSAAGYFGLLLILWGILMLSIALITGARK